MDMESILTIIGIVVLFGVAGACVFAIMKVKQILHMFDTKIDPKLDDLKVKTAALVPAVKQTGPLMESVNVALDALDVQIVEIDGKLDKLAGMTGTVTNALETLPEAAGQMKDTVKTQVKSQFRKTR